MSMPRAQRRWGRPQPEGQLWVPDDKARTVAWNVSERAYFQAALDQIAQVSLETGC